MNDRKMTDAQQIFAEIANALRLNPPSDTSYTQPHTTMPPVWITTLYEKPTSDDAQSDLERIACLECIIAILIEKNERMRQQLQMYMD